MTQTMIPLDKIVSGLSEAARFWLSHLADKPRAQRELDLRSIGALERKGLIEGVRMQNRWRPHETIPGWGVTPLGQQVADHIRRST